MEASVSLVLDNSPFEQGLNKSEGHAKSFGARLKGLLGGGAKSPWQDFVGGNELKGQLDKSGRDVETFGKKFESLFKRDPARRASIAFEQLAENLSSGDIPGAITGFAAKIGGIGLAASIGVGIAVGIFKKFTDDLIAARTASRGLQSEVSKPISITGGLGVAGINQEIEKTSKLIENVTEKTSGFTGRFFESLKSGGFLGGLKTLVTGGRLGGQPEAAQEVGAGLASLNQLLRERADTETQVAGIKEQQLKSSEEDAAVAAISVDTEQKKAEILNESLDRRNELSDKLKADEDTRRLGLGLGLSKDVRKKYEDELALINETDSQRISSAEKIGGLSREGAQQEFAIKNRSVAVEQDLANMSLQLRSSEEIREATLKSQLGLIEDQLNFDTQLTREKRAQLGVEKTRVQIALKNLTAEKFFQPGKFQAIEIGAAQERERQKAIPKGFEPAYPGQQVTRDISGNVVPSPAYGAPPGEPQFRGAYGVTGSPSESRGHGYESELDQFTKHMAPPGHMEPFQGTAEFQKVFPTSPEGMALPEQPAVTVPAPAYPSGLQEPPPPPPPGMVLPPATGLTTPITPPTTTGLQRLPIGVETPQGFPVGFGPKPGGGGGGGGGGDQPLTEAAMRNIMNQYWG